MDWLGDNWAVVLFIATCLGGVTQFILSVLRLRETRLRIRDLKNQLETQREKKEIIQRPSPAETEKYGRKLLDEVLSYLSLSSKFIGRATIFIISVTFLGVIGWLRPGDTLESGARNGREQGRGGNTLPGGGGHVRPGAGDDTKIAELIADLLDPDAGIRFAATSSLGNYSGETVNRALEKMLEDPSDFVRKMAIRNLARLNSISSIPRLIATLHDEDHFVRKTANVALQTLTKQDMGFDAESTAVHRAASIKKWQSWWERNKDELLKQ